MLTIAKITGKKSGYEVENGFCIVRDADKYEEGCLYVCKILSRFIDSKGNDHFVVTPISDHIVKIINFDQASKIYRNQTYGLSYLITKGYQQHVGDYYDDAVQDFFGSLA